MNDDTVQVNPKAQDKNNNAIPDEDEIIDELAEELPGFHTVDPKDELTKQDELMMHGKEEPDEDYGNLAGQTNLEDDDDINEEDLEDYSLGVPRGD